MKIKCLGYKSEIERKLKNIKDEVYGLHTPISEYVCDASGKLQEARVLGLIQELSNIRMRNHWAYQYYGISGVSKRCYEALLYLIIMSHSPNNEIETFADVLAVVDELNEGYKTLTALREDEESTVLIRPKGFFGTLYENYMELTGHSIVDDSSDEADIITVEGLRSSGQATYQEFMKGVCNAYKKESEEAWYPDTEPTLWDMVGMDEPVLIAEDEADYVIEDETEPIMAKRLWKIPTREEMLEREKQRTLSYEEWKNSFENPESFLQAYKDFRKLFFLSGIDRDELEDIFIAFLNDRGRVKVADDSAFVALCNVLEEVNKESLGSPNFKNKFR